MIYICSGCEKNCRLSGDGLPLVCAYGLVDGKENDIANWNEEDEE